MPTLGEVEAVGDSEGWVRASASLAAAREFAFDSEADAFHHYRARLCFIQAATDDALYVLDTLAADARLQLLAPALASADIVTYIHAASGDLGYLADAGLTVAGLFDTHRAATLLGWPKVGLADLVQQRCGIELAKAHQQSDFSLRPIPAEVLAYMADDVRYLLDVGRWVRDACQAADILEEVQLDCDKACADAIGAPEADRALAFNAAKLRTSDAPPAIAAFVAHELNRLRHEWAQAADLPFGRVLSNRALGAIAASLPGDERALRRTGVSSAFAREHGPEILATVAGARARAGQLPIPEPPARLANGVRRRMDVLTDWRKERALARKVTPSVVLPNYAIKQLALHPPAAASDLGELAFFGAKRLRLYGTELVNLLRHS